MNYFLAAQTEVGLKKSCNQDSVILKRAKFKGEEVCIGIICDGMGGLSCGELASKSIAEAFSEWFLYSYSKYESIWDESKMREDIGSIISSENEGLLRYGKEHGIYLGTTITAFLLAGKRFFVWHVGDSRLYKISSSKIERLTNDHTVIAKEVAEGRLTEKEAKNDPKRNVLLQCIGATERVNEISEKEMLSLLGRCESNKLNEMIKRLISLNLRRNEQDNISAALVKVQ